jgi:hypothetical protein
LPAPTLLSVKTNNKAVGQPTIVGLTKNNTSVKIYLDQKLIGEIAPDNNQSGTTNFAFKPDLTLTAGQHLVYTTAIDKHSKESKLSNPIYFQIGATIVARKPAISQVAVTEKKTETVSETVKPAVPASKPEAIKGEKAEVVPKTEIKTEEKVSDRVVQDLLKQGIATKTEATGLINENKLGQNKFQLNLIIFIVFLIGVIAWIFWVNRELIKERREQNKDKNQPDLKL